MYFSQISAEGSKILLCIILINLVFHGNAISKQFRQYQQQRNRNHRSNALAAKLNDPTVGHLREIFIYNRES